jgi:hypothetical protein
MLEVPRVGKHVSVAAVAVKSSHVSLTSWKHELHIVEFQWGVH